MQQLSEKNLQKNIIVFKNKPIRSSANWGNTNWWKNAPAAYENYQFTIYSNKAQNVKLSIKANDKLILKVLSADLLKGLNTVSYDLTYTKNVLKKYQAWLNENRKKEEKEIDLKQADNGNYYLRKGKYTVELVVNGEKYSGDFELK